jgi:AcrR family transcriptional regulator
VTSPSRRQYRSPKREQYAQATRTRILHAARALFLERGFAATTIAAIAEAATVAPQTVYACFRSKRGILAQIIDQAAFGPGSEDLVVQLRSASDGRGRLHAAVRIARQNHEARQAEIELLRGAGIISPELTALERTVGDRRRERTSRLIEFLMRGGELRPGLDPAEAHDLLWALTGADLYRLLVTERGWPASRYEEALSDLLTRILLEVTPAQRPDPR